MSSVLIQKNINKLLKGRQLYDDCRQAKEDAHVQEKHSGKLQEKLTQAINKRNVGLVKLGITSLEEFRQFNNAMCMAALQYCLEFVSVCDKCKGYEGTPPCLSTCGADSYYHTWTGSVADYAAFWKFLMHIHRHSVIQDHALVDISSDERLDRKLKPVQKQYKLGDSINISICPPGHGFLLKVVNPLPFSATWNFNGHIDS
ncbi:MAG: hypothetical protein PHO26_10090 [Dehalococcoidia bacterium]|nr:hypothetical protein [Dehalococcoidia bacterium]MDD5494286.1 hypothetical protein [Dehalococcoidia bacterium]